MIAKDMLVLQQQVYNFLRSATIKFEPAAEHINTDLIKRGFTVNTLDPYSWKYYLNMVGEYHESDEPMYVVSLDTRQQILFDKDILINHPRTKSVYQPGGLYYKRLCDIYPSQIDLIKSILFPVESLEKAIASDDLVLLSYGQGYLEEYEQPVIVDEINRFLEIVKERWYFTFLDDEALFHITFWGSLWTYLAMLVMSKRESLVNTPYVHSWHIWNKLKTKGIDDYSDVLNREKSMMLYQNIDYLKANAGKHSNLVILANRLLSDMGITIYGRKLVQETETEADNFQLTPQFQAVRIPTDNFNLLTEVTTASTTNIQNRLFQKGLTPDVSAETTESKERRLGNTRLNNLMTKFLEIRPLAKNKLYAYILNVFLVETLTTSIINGHYNEPVIINDQSVDVTLYLRPKELLALYHYASLKSIGVDAVDIPNKFSFYRSFKTDIGTPSKTIMRGDEKVYLSMYVNTQEFLSDLDYNEEIIYPNDFTEMVSRLWLKYMDHLLMDIKTKIERKRFILQYLDSLCHSRRVEEVDLIEGFTTYAEWLGPEGIDLESSVLSQYDVQLDPQSAWGSLADSIITALIPINEVLNTFGNFTLSDFGFERLRKLFVQMCSYRVVFLESTRDLPGHSMGLKWTSENGPDMMSSQGDRRLIRSLKFFDDQISQRQTYYLEGFTHVVEQNTVNSVKYTVTTSSNTEATITTEDREMNKTVSYTDSSFSSNGIINIVRPGIIPGGILG